MYKVKSKIRFYVLLGQVGKFTKNIALMFSVLKSIYKWPLILVIRQSGPEQEQKDTNLELVCVRNLCKKKKKQKQKENDILAEPLCYLISLLNSNKQYLF